MSKIRSRLGLPVFRRFSAVITDQCIQAGLVWGEELIFDAAKVRANAAVTSLVPRLRLLTVAHLAALAEDTAVVPASEAEERWDLLEACRLDPDRPAAEGYERTSDRMVSTTDPDAVAMKATGQKAALDYHDHYVIDGGKARIILHALVTPADVMENQPMRDLLRRVRFRWRVKPQRVIADTTYGTAENIRAIEESGIREDVPLPDWKQRTPYYGASRFTYNGERDVYRCPQGGDIAPTPSEQDATVRALPGRCGGLQCLPGENGMYQGNIGASDRALLSHRVSRAGARASRDRGVQESDAQAEGVDRTALWRSEAVAWNAAVPVTRVAEGK